MILTIIAVLIAITVHETAHAWAAYQLGDPTAKLYDRISLNPLNHLDPIGTLSLFLFGFGWGKPVPVDSYNLQNPKKDEAIISLAGPLSNVVTAAILGLIIRFTPFGSFMLEIGLRIMFINLGLGIFNLLPIYPLDGSKILLGLLPFEISQEVENFMRRYGILTLLAVLVPIFGGRSIVDLILQPAMVFFINLFI